MLTAAGMARMPARVMMALVGSPDEGYTAAELSERLGRLGGGGLGRRAIPHLDATDPPRLAAGRPARPLRPHRATRGTA